jgi:methionine-rich copper-binding protein CopC
MLAHQVKSLATARARLARPILFALITAAVTGCASSSDYTPLLSSQPEAGSELTRAPRTLRLFYDALPDVSRSSLKLIGPAGEHSLRGLHTMAADDLMIEIMDPVTVGDYTVEWETVVGDDPTVYRGAYQFTVLP